MDVKQQEYFLAIAEECNLSKAAQRLYVSQPSLSQFLSKLEDSMNIQLFYRSSSNILSLTEAGKLYYDSAQKILQINNEFNRKLEDLKESTSMKLTFGINDDRGVRVLSEILTELTDKHPELCIEIKNSTAYKLTELVAEYELDLAFSAFQKKNLRLEYIEFPPYEVALVMSVNHSLAHLGTTTPLENLPYLPLKYFQNQKFLMLKPYTVLRDIEDAYCENIDFKPDIKIEAHNISATFQILLNSSYVTLLPINLIPNLKSNYSYIGLDPPLYYNIGIYYNKNIYKTKLMQDFLVAAKKVSASY